MPVLINPYAFGVTYFALDFEFNNSQYLNISDANFGAFDRAKWAYSVWFKPESLGGGPRFTFQQGFQPNSTISFEFSIGNDGSNDLIDVFTYADGSTLDGRIRKTGLSLVGAWHHTLFHYDSANGTGTNRMRLWLDGTEITSFDVDTHPSAAVFNSSADILLGREAGGGGNYYDGLLYQAAFFSGSLPAIGDVYNAGSPKNISSLPGLFSLLQGRGGNVVQDEVLAALWTNNNSVTADAGIPT